jgi:tRNA(adenine34) deaminase
LGTLFDVSADERLNHAFEVTKGVREEECADLLRQFFRRRRKEARAAKKAAREGLEDVGSEQENATG